MKCIYTNKEVVCRCLTCKECKPINSGECIYCGCQCKDGDYSLKDCCDYNN